MRDARDVEQKKFRAKERWRWPLASDLPGDFPVQGEGRGKVQPPPASEWASVMLSFSSLS